VKRGKPLERRTPLKAKAQLKVGRKHLSPRSAKRVAQAEERRRVVEFVHQRDHSCRAADIVPEVACAGPLDVDEVISRASWAAGYLDPTNCQLLCRAHHRWKHEHPAAAVVRGLSRWSWHRGGVVADGDTPVAE